MKKLFTLFLMVAMTTAMFAQEAVLNKLWEESRRSGATYDPDLEEWTESAPPEWMGPSMWGPTERGLAVVNDKLYIPSRKNGNEIIVLDAADGSKIATIVLPDVNTADPENGIDSVAGGIYDINSISTTESGDLILGNLATNTQSHNFMAYQIKLDAAGTNYTMVKNIISWNNIADTASMPSFRIGDGIAFYGDIADGKNGYLVTAAAASNYILRWDVTSGVVSADPQIYQVADVNGTPVNFDVSPQCDPVSEDIVIVDGKGMFPIAYDMASADPNALETVASFPVSAPTEGYVTPQTSNLNGVDYFEFKGRYFMACVTNWWQYVKAINSTDTIPPNTYEVFEFKDGDWAQATSLGLVPTDGLTALTTSKNASFVYPVKVKVEADRAVIYIMSSPLGIAAYELTISESTAIKKTFSDNVHVYPNPASDVVHFSTEMKSVSLFNVSGELVKSEYNVSKINVSGLKGLYIINGIDNSGNPVHKKVYIK